MAAIEVTTDGIRLLAAWNALARRERDHYLREIEAASAFWNNRPADQPAPAFLAFMRATLEAPANELPASAGRVLDMERVGRFADAIVAQLKTTCEAQPKRRMQLAQGLAEAISTALASEDRDECRGAQIALSALLVQFAKLVDTDNE